MKRTAAIETVRAALRKQKKFNGMLPATLEAIGDTLEGIIDGSIPIKGKGGRPPGVTAKKADAKKADAKKAKTATRGSRAARKLAAVPAEPAADTAPEEPATDAAPDGNGESPPEE